MTSRRSDSSRCVHGGGVEGVLRRRSRPARSGSRSATTAASVVNLRVPLALGRAALDRIPGLSESMTDRIREALATGFKGPLVQVDDEGGGVRIAIE